MSVMEFWFLRRADRRARKAHKAMFRVYGESWARNAAGVVDLLVSPSPVYVLDVEMLRGVVAEALAGAEEQAIPVNTFPVEPMVGEPAEVEPAAEAAEPFAEPLPLRDQVFEDRNGVAGPVDMSNDERRRAFVRSFLDEQKAVRGGLPTSLRS